MLLLWGGTTVLGHLITQWQNLQAGQIGVVCAAHDQVIQSELDRLHFPQGKRILNPSPERGMFSSIQCAAQWAGWNASLTHFAVVLGDQPHLGRNTLQALMDFALDHPGKICQPSRNGRARHPVLLPRPTFLELAHAPADNLKQFIQGRPQDQALCEMDDLGLDLDIDRPEDYERVVRLCLGPRQ